jgi:hypothetical protein
VELRVDPNLPSIEAGYGNVETSCDRRTVGPNACVADKGDPTEEKKLTVRTIQSGVLSVYSHECGIEWSTRYSESGYVEIPLTELIGPLFEKTCLLSILINPEYEDQEESTVKVYGFHSEVLLKVVESGEPAEISRGSEVWNGAVPLQIREPPTKPSDEYQAILVDVGGSQEGFYRLTGCGRNHNGQYHYGMNIHYTQYQLQKPCVYHGAIVPTDNETDLLFSVMVNIFKNDYIRLDKPNFIQDGKDLLLDFDRTVTFVEVGDTSYNKSQVSINRYDPNERYEVRAYTVKGRYIVGIHEDGGWKWYR